MLFSACLGEASVSYQGTVTEGAQSEYSFDEQPNPSGGAPVVGATVALCVDGCNGNEKTVTTSDDGSYAEIDTVFGGSLDDKIITLQVSTQNGRVVSYKTVYSDTEDPTIANPSCEDPCPPVYLNFTVAP